MEKLSLSIKTKIAAWGMIGVGGLEVVVGLAALITGLRELAEGLGEWFPMFLLFPIFLGFIAIISGYLLLKRKKGAWWLAVVTLFIAGVGSHLFMRFILIILFLLLFFDRKNFWKIAS